MDRDDLANFLVGLGVGAIAGLLFAPYAGAETRGILAGKAGGVPDYVRDRGVSVRDTAGELLQRGREIMNRQRDHLREAIDAGKQAYRDTVNHPPESGTSGPEPNPGM
jgi:gas vesicle protein